MIGKHKPTYVPHVDNGDFVVVVNARHVVLTANKMKTKLYRWHTGWMGGLKELTARQVHERAPDRIIEHAVKGMLPPNNLRAVRMKRLRIFADDAHKHVAQVAGASRYGSEFLAKVSPRPFHPRPKKASGNLVADVFATKGNAALQELSKTLQVQDPAEALKELEAELARRAAAAQQPLK